MNVGIKQNIVLAIFIALAHAALLYAMQWLWQPPGKIKRIPDPIFARIIQPQTVELKNYSEDAPTENASQPDLPDAKQQPSASNEMAATLPSDAKPADPVDTSPPASPPPPQQRAIKKLVKKPLWKPLLADKKPSYQSNSDDLSTDQEAVVTTQAPVTNPVTTPVTQPIITTPATPQPILTTPTPIPAPAVSITPPPQAAIETAEAKTTAAHEKPTSQNTPAPIRLTNPMDAWPVSTQLNYRVGGNFRGKVSGSAQVTWIKQGTTYQSQVDMDFGIIPGVKMTSQGTIFPTGLKPDVFEEKQGVGSWKSVKFEISHITINDGRKVKNPDKRIGAMLDPASQFVEFSHRFSTGSLPLKKGTVFDFWLGRPEAIYRWQYQVSGPMLLALPEYGDVVVHHVQPTELSLKGRENKGYIMEMWYAPELQYLPVRIKLWTTKKEGYIDLLLQNVQQTASQ